MNELGEHCPINLGRPDSLPYVCVLGRWSPEATTRRINGYLLCSGCGVWLPWIEEATCWTEMTPSSGCFVVSEWFGQAWCELCERLFVMQPDGQLECYAAPAPDPVLIHKSPK